MGEIAVITFVLGWFGGMFWKNRSFKWMIQTYAKDRRPFFIEESNIGYVTNEGNYKIEWIEEIEARRMEDEYRKRPSA